jgi:hypothetical protein
MIINNIKSLKKYLVPLFYFILILAIAFIQINHQKKVRNNEGSPLFRNLMNYTAFVREGFDPEDILEVPEVTARSKWMRFNSAPLRIADSPLPDLPKRTAFSPFGNEEKEFTILIPVEYNLEINDYKSDPPGIYLGYIGENWEIYLNGNLAASQMHMDESGIIESRRNWRGVYYPLDINSFVHGTNILAFRITGDPSLDFTGFYYSVPYYMDNYSKIEKRNLNIPFILMSGVFAYIGIYYLFVFLSARRKREIFNLYFGLFSVFLCLYSLMFNGTTANLFFPDSDISVRLEYAALFMMLPMLGLLIEHLVRRRTTRASRVFLLLSIIPAVTQIFFCTQYGNEILAVWSVFALVYFAYLFAYHIVYFYFFEQRKNKEFDNPFLGALIGSVLIYLCISINLFNVVFLHKFANLFIYSVFVFHITAAFALSSQFRLAHEKLMQMQNAILKIMAELIEYRDDITGRHIGRTQQGIKILVGELIKNSPYENEAKEWDVDVLIQASQLHDIGKISISDRILKKPDKLTEDEYEDMKLHVHIGRQIMEKIEALTQKDEFLKYAKIFAANHHERWDGTGYPRGLKGEEIPLLGRLMAISDVYDALVSVRPYKKAFTHEEAVKIISENKGTQFDPVLVDLFLQVEEKFKDVS